MARKFLFMIRLACKKDPVIRWNGCTPIFRRKKQHITVKRRFVKPKLSIK